MSCHVRTATQSHNLHLGIVALHPFASPIRMFHTRNADVLSVGKFLTIIVLMSDERQQIVVAIFILIVSKIVKGQILQREVEQMVDFAVRLRTSGCLERTLHPPEIEMEEFGCLVANLCHKARAMRPRYLIANPFDDGSRERVVRRRMDKNHVPSDK